MAALLLVAEYWLVAGLILAALEIFAPGFFFLGFGAGSALTGLIVWPLAGSLAGAGTGWAWPLLIFAVLSTVAILLLRRIFSGRRRKRDLGDDDVNDLPYKGDGS